MTSFDLWQFISYKNLVTWSHVTTCDYLVTGSHMESQVVTLVTVVETTSYPNKLQLAKQVNERVFLLSRNFLK